MDLFGFTTFDTCIPVIPRVSAIFVLMHGLSLDWLRCWMKNESCFKWSFLLFSANNVDALRCAMLRICANATIGHFLDFTLLTLHLLVNNIGPTLGEVIELAQHSFVLPTISCSAKKGPVGSKDYHVLLFLLWRTDNIWTETRSFVLS